MISYQIGLLMACIPWGLLIGFSAPLGVIGLFGQMFGLYLLLGK